MLQIGEKFLLNSQNVFPYYLVLFFMLLNFWVITLDNIQVRSNYKESDKSKSVVKLLWYAVEMRVKIYVDVHLYLYGS